MYLIRAIIIMALIYCATGNHLIDTLYVLFMKVNRCLVVDIGIFILLRKMEAYHDYSIKKRSNKGTESKAY